ncbi:MAG TPA: endolytic transglycosylase MltG [Gemmatimonadaceae bacterium]|nr:endolytic transglycosylase MltG [Gemmatimonadaceae bacterium]
MPNAGAASRRILTIGALALTITIGACGGEGGGRAGPALRVNIPSGASFGQATDSLHDVGLVQFPRLFRLYAKMSGRDRNIKAGTYVLEGNLSWNEILDALTRGEGIESKVTIPEGYALRDIVALLVKELELSEDSVEAAVRDTSLLRALNIPTRTLEGYLFPDTYQFMHGTSARQAIRDMVQRFEQVWEPAWDERLQELAMSRHDIVTLASIIEKEARLAEERPVISAVYHNRLRAQMPLQADPTVQYARGQHSERVLYRDLDIDSPYNTYKNRGLPPGPIASPGKSSIEAALRPAQVDYMFFVAHPDGHHEFRETFKEHVEARQDVRRERRRNGSR